MGSHLFTSHLFLLNTLVLGYYFAYILIDHSAIVVEQILLLPCVLDNV